VTVATGSPVSWIDAAGKAVALAKDADEAQRQVALLEDAKADLAGLIGEFRQLAEGISVVRTLGWEGRSPNPELARDLSEAMETLGERPLIRALRALERFRGDVEVAVKARWSGYASEQLGDVSDLLSLSETLSEVEGITELSESLRNALGDLARAEGSIPSKASVALLTTARSSLRRLEDSLKPESVRLFLSAAARGGASIELLTSDVLDWLRSHNALARFRIAVGPPVDADD
jgi:hypothetical protein